MKPEKIIDAAYEQIAQTIKNPRQLSSLQCVKAACDYLNSNGVRISLAAIEGYCIDRKWDGPKAQSIRNSKHVLLKYVELRKSGQNLVSSRVSTSKEPNISDESIKAYVQLLKEELRQANESFQRIQTGLRNIPGIPVDDLIRSGLHGIQMTTRQPAQAHSEICGALRALFDAKCLERCGLELYKDRIRHVTTKNVLLEKEHVLTLQAAIRST